VPTTLIVFDAPTLQDDARLAQIAEEFTVKAFIAQLVVEALNMPVLPRAPRLDVKRLDLLGLQPVLDDKLGSVVAAQLFGHAVAGDTRFDWPYAPALTGRITPQMCKMDAETQMETAKKSFGISQCQYFSFSSDSLHALRPSRGTLQPGGSRAKPAKNAKKFRHVLYVLCANLSAVEIDRPSVLFSLR
jgi:hypothetical protein